MYITDLNVRPVDPAVAGVKVEGGGVGDKVLGSDGERILGVDGVGRVDGCTDDVLAAGEEHEGLGDGARLGRGRRGLLSVRACAFWSWGKIDRIDFVNAFRFGTPCNGNIRRLENFVAMLCVKICKFTL